MKVFQTNRSRVLTINLLFAAVAYVIAWAVNLFLNAGPWMQTFWDVGPMVFSLQDMAGLLLLLGAPVGVARDLKHKNSLAINILIVAAIGAFLLQTFIVMWLLFLFALVWSVKG